MQSLSLSLAPSDNQLLLPTDSGTEPKWAWQGQGSRHDVILLPQALPGRLQWSATVDQEGGCGQGAWPHKETTHILYVHCFYTHFSLPPLLPPPQVDIFAQDLVLVPIHLGMHWALATLDMKRNRVCYYDSLHGNAITCLQRLTSYLVSEAKDKKGESLDPSSWTTFSPSVSHMMVM